MSMVRGGFQHRAEENNQNVSGYWLGYGLLSFLLLQYESPLQHSQYLKPSGSVSNNVC